MRSTSLASDRSTTTRRCCLATAGRFRLPGRCARTTARSASPGTAWTPSSTPAPILAQTTVPIEDDWTTIEEMGPTLIQAAFELLPQVFERLAAGDPGDPQSTEGASWAGLFEEDYANVDWSQPARTIHDQVRAWHLSFGMSPVVRADRGARRRARQAPAHEPHRPGGRRTRRRVRRREPLDPGVRAR